MTALLILLVALALSVALLYWLARDTPVKPVPPAVDEAARHEALCNEWRP